MQLFIKNMVCNRCIMAVQQVLDQQALTYRKIELGEVELMESPSNQQLDSFRSAIEALGFELLDDKKSTLISKIKTTLLQLIRADEPMDYQVKLSVLLSETLGHDYHYLSTLFSSTEGITIEKFFIAQKIERAKELLLYNEHSLSQIADQLGYSSVQHLSQQFKKQTGLTPSHFRQLKDKKRLPLDEVGRS